MVELLVKGKVWKFGDSIDTDVITPGKYLTLPMDELRLHVMEPIDPDFSREVKEGDVIVAGRNFGCGSSREQAAEALKSIGIRAVAAESFARIFFRNAIAIGLPVLACDGVSKAFDEGDEMELDLRMAEIRNLTRGTSLVAKKLPKQMLEIIEAGGAISLLAKMFAKSK